MSEIIQLVARGVEPELVERLDRRAVERGVSREEEHLNILRAALLPNPTADSFQSLKDMLFQMPAVGDDRDFERVRDLPRKVDLA